MSGLSRKYRILIFLIPACMAGCGTTIGKEEVDPEDTGFYIGTQQFIWEDVNRRDDYYGGTRKLNVQVWYPGEEIPAESQRTPYLLFRDQLQHRLEGWKESDFQAEQQIKTASFIGVPFSNQVKTAPLLVFSPSLGGNVSYYTYYAEYFARQGYIVMGINHLYESEAIVDPEGRVYAAHLQFHDSLKTLKIPEEISAEKYREVMGVRQKVLAEDLLFALDQLLLEEAFKSKINTDHIGVFGHSMGGAAAIYAALLDSRIKVVINLDGTPPTVALDNGIDAPFLYLEDLTDYRNHPGYAKMHKRRSDFCERNRADSWRILINGFNHNSFLDINYYFAQDKEVAMAEKEKLNLILEYMDAFLSHYLLGLDELNLAPMESASMEIIYFEK